MKGPRMLWILGCILLVLLPAGLASANSAEPPALVLVVNSPPEDFALSMRFDGQTLDVQERNVAWEHYYVLYYNGMPRSIDLSAIEIGIHANGEDYTLALPEGIAQMYDTVVTLNLTSKALSPGMLPLRTVMLVALRVLLTLVLEGLCFYLFGFREQRSWIAFLIINLITQGLLNISLAGSSPFNSYLIVGLVLMEILVLIVELLAFLFALKEHKRPRRALYAVAANILSLVLGGLLITYLPV